MSYCSSLLRRYSLQVRHDFIKVIDRPLSNIQGFSCFLVLDWELLSGMVNQATNPRCRLTYLVDSGTLMFIKTYQILRVEINLFSLCDLGLQEVEVRKVDNEQKSIKNQCFKSRLIEQAMEYELFRRLLISGGFQWVLFHLHYDSLGSIAAIEEASSYSYLEGAVEMFQFLCKWKKKSKTYHSCCSAQLLVKRLVCEAATTSISVVDQTKKSMTSLFFYHIQCSSPFVILLLLAFSK